jgi:hypothetical protein
MTLDLTGHRGVGHIIHTYDSGMSVHVQKPMFEVTVYGNLR